MDLFCLIMAIACFIGGIFAIIAYPGGCGAFFKDGCKDSWGDKKKHHAPE